MAIQPQHILQHNSEAVAKAIELRAEQATQRIHQALGRGAMEVAREAQERMPKFRSTMATATRAADVGTLEWHNTFGVHYADDVEAGSRPGGWVPLAEMLDWIRLKGIRPRTPGVTLESLAHIIRRSIYENGINGQHFARESLEAKRQRVIELVERAAVEAIGTPA